MYSVQAVYLPKIFEHLYLGMTLESFKLQKDTSQMEIDENVFISYYTEDIENEDVIQLTYQFDKEKILYEMIVQYRNAVDVQQLAVDSYGQPNNGDEWLIPLEDGLTIKIWRFGKSLCIADAQYFEVSN